MDGGGTLERYAEVARLLENYQLVHVGFTENHLWSWQELDAAGVLP